MRPYLPIMMAAGLLAFLATPLTRVLAHRLGMLDRPGLRKQQRLPVPLLGGLALYLALAVTFVIFGQREWWLEGVGILGGATLLFLTGLWDDRNGMPAWVKLAAEGVAGVCVMAVGIQVHLLGVVWLDGLITLAWLVGIANAVNLMDNMDGLAAGITAVAAAFFFALAALEGQVLVATLAAALAGASAGFLFYNLAPAVSFMGDAGALTLGFVLAVLGIKLRFISHPLGSTWMAPIIVLGVLIFDTTLVSLSRLRRGRSIFQGGSDHTSHRLVQLGLSQPRAVLTLYVAAGALGLLAIWVIGAPVLLANLTFGLLVLGGLAALIVFERVEPKLSGDPPLVLIPGGGGFGEAVRAATALSREVVVLLAPRRLGGEVRPTRDEVVEALAALAEEPAAARRLLARALPDEWWTEVNGLNQVLRLHGLAWCVLPRPAEALPEPGPEVELEGEPQPDVLAAIARARLVLLGPGDPAVNLAPALAAPGVRAALLAGQGPRLWGGSAAGQAALEAWLGEPPHYVVAAPARLEHDLQSRLLEQAAGHVKTSEG